MKALFDTNIILDVMLARGSYARPAALLLSEVERGRIEGYLSAITITTIFYLASKTVNKKIAKEQIQNLLAIFKISPINQKVLNSALEMNFTDYEDAVLNAAAIESDVEFIVTRNAKDLQKSHLTIVDADDLLYILKSKEKP